MKQTRVCKRCNKLHTVELSGYEMELGICFKNNCDECVKATMKELQLAYKPSTTLN